MRLRHLIVVVGCLWFGTISSSISKSCMFDLSTYIPFTTVRPSLAVIELGSRTRAVTVCPAVCQDETHVQPCRLEARTSS
jgi:hypothetical protein